MGGQRVLGINRRAGAGELPPIVRTPGEEALGGMLVGLDQRLAFLQEPLGEENLRQGPAADVPVEDLQCERDDPRHGVGLQVDQDVPRFLFAGRREVDTRDQVGQRLAGGVELEQPAAQSALEQVLDHRWQQALEFVLGIALAPAASAWRMVPSCAARRAISGPSAR